MSQSPIKRIKKWTEVNRTPEFRTEWTERMKKGYVAVVAFLGVEDIEGDRLNVKQAFDNLAVANGYKSIMPKKKAVRK